MMKDERDDEGDADVSVTEAERFESFLHVIWSLFLVMVRDGVF